jgi:hypothetical protein
VLKLVIPKGSLERATLELFEAADLTVRRSSDVDYRASIERELRSMPERDRLSFVYVDLPDRVRSWQRGDRWLRSYYLPWQIAALREARRLQRSVRFDVVWHLTWANAWYGSLAALAGRARASTRTISIRLGGFTPNFVPNRPAHDNFKVSLSNYVPSSSRFLRACAKVWNRQAFGIVLKSASSWK